MNLAGRESSVKLATYGNVKISLLSKVNRDYLSPTIDPSFTIILARFEK